jgi:hypothetical protein
VIPAVLCMIAGICFIVLAVLDDKKYVRTFITLVFGILMILIGWLILTGVIHVRSV